MSKKSRDILIAALTVSLLGFVIFLRSPRRSNSPIELSSGQRIVMGTFARILVIAADANTAKNCIEAAFSELVRIDELMSDYKADSQTSRINRDAYEKAVPVSSDTFEVLQRAVEFSKVSDGAFDITIGPLTQLWRRATDSNSTPSESELAEARARTGYEKLILDADEKSVRFAIDGMRLDLGAIAKGYAIDKAVEAMRNAGVLGAMVDVGGDIYCFGQPPKGRSHWLIGLQDPEKPGEIFEPTEPMLVLKLVDSAIATSGDYRRFVLIDGQKFSHIIDTRTGISSGKLSSVTIISKSAIDADALATAVSVMGEKKGLALIEKIPETEAILISSDPNQTPLKTSGAEKFLINSN
jgi:thiamine biosynthesis lipoprotein